MQHEIEHQTGQEGQGEDGAMNARMAEQEQGGRQANGTTPAIAQEDAGDDDQQEAQGIRTGDHAVLVEREVTKGEQRALQPIERCETGHEEDGRGGDGEVQRLHGHGGSRHPGQGHEQQVPQGGMAVVLQVREQVRRIRAVTSQQPGLQLVAPHLVVGQPEGEQQRIYRGQDGGEPEIGRSPPILYTVPSARLNVHALSFGTSHVPSLSNASALSMRPAACSIRASAITTMYRADIPMDPGPSPPSPISRNDP